MEQTKRENWIDSLKLIAMLIVVMNHAGCIVPGFSFWGGMFYVPVFFVLSGYTCHSKEESLKKTVGKKTKRLLVPYFTANLFLLGFFFIKDVLLTRMKTAWQGLSAILGILYGRNRIFSFAQETLLHPAAQETYPLMTILNAPTWFLPALFLTILLYEAAARFLARDEKKIWLLAMILLCFAVCYHYLTPLLLPWSLDAVAFFFLLYLTGIAVRKHDLLGWADAHKWILPACIILLALSGLYNGSANLSIGDYGRSVMLALVNAASSSLLMMYLLWKGKKYIPAVLGMAGRQTLFLLCYHMLVLEILKTLIPGIPLFVRVVLAMALLAGIGVGKDAMMAARKERRGRHAER